VWEQDNTEPYFAIGWRMIWNFAWIEFLSITFLAPFSFLTLSSFGRLNANVWTDLM
jgi:hypothetical protein